MAKTLPHAIDDDATEPEISAKLGKAIATLRVTFRSFVEDFTALTTDRQTLAPRLMKTFAMWQAETGGSFVAFIRVLVPGVPLERAGYRAHFAYQAADYLRRLTQATARTTESPIERAARIQRAPVSPRVAMARLVASILPLISPDTTTVLWSALSDQLHWSEATVKSLQELCQSETPLVQLKAPRGTAASHSFRAAPVPVPDSEEAAA